MLRYCLPTSVRQVLICIYIYIYIYVYNYIYTYLNPPEPTFLSGPYKFHIRVYKKTDKKVGFGRLR